MADPIVVRPPESIYQARGEIENGTFAGRWHFSFDEYYDPHYERFGTLRVLNDDTLSPGAVWPLHPHRNIEVVTYCVAGEFRHADEHGVGGVLLPGSVQHTTVGRGLWHSEINNRPDEPLRFIQMWFRPAMFDAQPGYEQKEVDRADRTNRLLPLVSNDHDGALRILSDARVFSAFLEAGRSVAHEVQAGRGAYVYVLEGGPLAVDGASSPVFGALVVRRAQTLTLSAIADTELLLVDVLLR
jgi:redox-sensitive bicupin YhaK (pirin superfamily)